MESNTEATAQKSNKSKIIIFGICAVLVIVALVTTLVFMITDHEPEIEIQGANENTPILKLYSKIEDGMTLGEIEDIVKQDTQGTVVTYEDDYTGSISIPNYPDYIMFGIVVDDEDITEYSEETADDYYAAPAYESDDSIYDLSYNLFEKDDGYRISFSEYYNTYQLASPSDIQEFPTKQEAIDTYLKK